MDSVDLASTSPISATVRHLESAKGKQENLSYASWKICLDRLLVRSAAENIN